MKLWFNQSRIPVATRGQHKALLLALALLAPTSAFADKVEYYYNAANQLVQAVNVTTGQADILTYDANGNLISVVVVATSKVTVSGFAPAQGPVGTQVTINGTGFDPTTNTVKFNGTTASVVSSNATQIVATVPSGAPSGPISVSNAAGSAVSSNSFTVTTGAGSAPAATVSPTILSFASQNVNTTSAAQTVILTNTGNQALASIAITKTGNFAQTNNCGTSLAVNASCIINVTFTPTAAGVRNGTVSIASNAPTTPNVVSLSGTGVGTGPTGSLTPASLTFADQSVGTTSAAQALTLTNTGGSSMSISSIAPSGDFAQTNNCGASLAASASCTINVTFTPTASGARSGSVSVTSNASNSPNTSTLSGNGTASAVSVNPTSLTFAARNLNTTSAAQSITVTNTGNVALTIASGAVTLTGSNPGDFAKSADTCSNTSVAVNGTCTISVTFTPTAIGARSANISIASNDPASPKLVPLSGTGNGAAASASPTSLTFAARNLNTTSAAQSITVTNTGNVALTIAAGAVTLTGANPGDFAKSADTCSNTSVAANGTCTISVTFTPTAVGARAANVSIASNDPASPKVVPLSGTGNGAVASASPTSLAFGNQALNTTSAAQTVTITNTGNVALTIAAGAVTITGTNASEFTKGTDTCSNSSVAANGTCTIGVAFRPTANGARSASINIASNDPASPKVVAMSGTGTSAIVSVNPTSLTFAARNLNTTSAAQTVTVTNTGNVALTPIAVTLTGSNPGDFAKSADTCTGASVAANGTCTISVTFTPTATGARSANINIASNDPATPKVVPMTGTGNGAAATPSPTSLSFGNQAVNTTSAAQTVTITNTGNSPLLVNLNGVTITGTNAAEFTKTADTCSSSTVLAAGTCTISVTFRPTANGARSANISIASNDPGSPTVVPMSGTGTSAILGVSPTSLAYGNQAVNTTSAAQTVTVTNNGNVALTSIAVTLTGTNAADFTKTADTCSGASVAAAATCTISVTFKPTANGARSASISIASNDPASPKTVAMAGTGQSAIVSPSPTSVAFGNQALNTTSAAQTVTVTNTGNVALTIAAGAVTITGTNASEFTKATDTCSNSSVAANGTCMIGVTFRPTANGARSANINIASNDPASPKVVAMSGTGTSAIASASPSSLAFGNQALNTTSAAQTVTITNTGNVALTIAAGAVTITGTNASEFTKATDTCSNSSVAANGTCMIGVTFRPTANGARSASISIASNDPASPKVVPMSGTGTSAIVGVSPTSLAYGNQAVNTTSAAQTVTVTNNGNVALTSIAVTLTGTNATDFTKTADTCSGASVAAAATCTISVTFKPTANGARSANINIASNDPASPKVVAMSGTGQSAIVSPNPPSLSFGNQALNTTSAAQTVTVTNNGNVALSSIAVTLTGTNAADFAKTADTCSGNSVAANGTCTISVTFRPTVNGTRSANISIASNDPASPKVVAMSGTGTSAIASASPTSVAFGNQALNTTSAAQTVTITNTGNVALTIATGAVTITGTNASEFTKSADTCSNTSVAANGTCTISVTFRPTANGARSASLNIVSNDPASPEVVPMSGTGTSAIASASPTSLAYGNQAVNTTSAAQSVTITNTGNVALTIASGAVTITGTNAAEFTKTADTCSNSSVATNGTCTISVTFRPTANGARSASLNIASNDPASPKVIAMSGTGQSAIISPSPTSLSYGNQPVGTTSAAQTVTVTNTGNIALTSIAVTLTGANAADFAKTVDTCTGASVAANGTCTISVTFTPSVNGTRNANINIASNDPSSPKVIAMSGTGASAIAGVGPTSLAYGNQPVNTTSAAQTVTVTNNGNIALTSIAVTLTGTNASDFTKSTDTCTGASVAPTSTCTISVTFRPPVNGARSANISIASNDPASPKVVPMSGTGTSAIASASPTSLAFGNQGVNTTSAAQSVTITNTGNVALTIAAGAVTITGTNAADFTKSADTCSNTSVAVNGTCSISVTFKPAANGARSANISIASNDPASPKLVPLSGTGQSASASVNPTSLTYANRQVNTTSAAQTVTVTNNGNIALTIASGAVTLTGSSQGDFTKSADTCSGATVAVNGTCTISVTFKPTALGTRTANVQIVSNDPTSPKLVPLSGTANLKIDTFTDNPSSIKVGGSTTITWATTNAVSCTAGGQINAWSGAKATSGSLTITPVKTPGTYQMTLTCTDSASNSASQSINLTITLN